MAIYEAIRNNTEPPMTIEEGRNILVVEKAIFESIETRQIVDYAKFLSRWGTTQPRGG